ncbi:MAG: succinylglutamate desuccinylase/aspartoacylase family protein [Alphaproteobacteria bacterium]
MTGRTRLWTEIDFERDGRQVGTLNLPHSVTRSAYGVIPIPLAVFRNGAGPTILLMAGNHGDEYEGQIVLGDLIRTLDPAAIKGRVIVLPAANLPAAKAGARVSPLDGGNLNRAFPGDPTGPPTSQIAYYLSETLVPMADLFVDLHAGGASLSYLPFVSLALTGEDALDRRTLAAARAFGAPRIIVWGKAEADGTSTTPAKTHRVPKLGGEYGGAGVVSPDGVGLVARGVRNLLAHLGITRAAPEPAPAPRPPEISDCGYYAFAPSDGVFAPAVGLGDEVAKGALVGHVHVPEHPDRSPEPVAIRRTGLVICTRAIGRVEAGDCLLHLASDRADPLT